MGEEARAERRERESATIARRGCKRLWGAAGVSAHIVRWAEA